MVSCQAGHQLGGLLPLTSHAIRAHACVTHTALRFVCLRPQASMHAYAGSLCRDHKLGQNPSGDSTGIIIHVINHGELSTSGVGVAADEGVPVAGGSAPFGRRSADISALVAGRGSASKVGLTARSRVVVLTSVPSSPRAVRRTTVSVCTRVCGASLLRVARRLCTRTTVSPSSSKARCVTTCVEIKILRRVRAESSRRPLRHRRDACSMAWRCRFLTTQRSQHGRVTRAPDTG